MAQTRKNIRYIPIYVGRYAKTASTYYICFISEWLSRKFSAYCFRGFIIYIILPICIYCIWCVKCVFLKVYKSYTLRGGHTWQIKLVTVQLFLKTHLHQLVLRASFALVFVRCHNIIVMINGFIND